MSHGFVYLAEAYATSFPFTELLASIGRAGVSIANPWSHLVTELNDEGDQVHTRPESIALALEQRPTVTFQFWLSEDTDLTCSFRRLSDGLYVHAYGLDGLDQSEARRIMEWAKTRFEALMVEKHAVLLVLDAYGVTADFDWDAFAVGNATVPNILPELIGVTKSLLNERTARLGHSAGAEFGDYVWLSQTTATDEAHTIAP